MFPKMFKVPQTARRRSQNVRWLEGISYCCNNGEIHGS